MSSSERRPVSAGSVTEQLRRAATRTVAAWAPRLGRWLAAGAAVAAAMVAVAKVPAMLAVVALLFAFRRMLRRQHGRHADRGGASVSTSGSVLTSGQPTRAPPVDRHEPNRERGGDEGQHQQRAGGQALRVHGWLR